MLEGFQNVMHRPFGAGNPDTSVWIADDFDIHTVNQTMHQGGIAHHCADDVPEFVRSLGERRTFKVIKRNKDTIADPYPRPDVISTITKSGVTPVYYVVASNTVRFKATDDGGGMIVCSFVMTVGRL